MGVLFAPSSEGAFLTPSVFEEKRYWRFYDEENNSFDSASNCTWFGIRNDTKGRKCGEIDIKLSGFQGLSQGERFAFDMLHGLELIRFLFTHANSYKINSLISKKKVTGTKSQKELEMPKCSWCGDNYTSLGTMAARAAGFGSIARVTGQLGTHYCSDKCRLEAERKGVVISSNGSNSVAEAASVAVAAAAEAEKKRLHAELEANAMNRIVGINLDGNANALCNSINELFLLYQQNKTSSSNLAKATLERIEFAIRKLSVLGDTVNVSYFQDKVKHIKKMKMLLILIPAGVFGVLILFVIFLGAIGAI